MTRFVALVFGALSVSACTSLGDSCDTRPLGEIAPSERSSALVAQAEGLASAIGAWTATVDSRTVTLTLSTAVDTIEVDLGGELCGGGGGTATSSVQVDTSDAVTDTRGTCNLVVADEPAWCEFEAAEGAWSVEVDTGVVAASFAPVLVGGSGEDGIAVTSWVRAE